MLITFAVVVILVGGLGAFHYILNEWSVQRAKPKGQHYEAALDYARKAEAKKMRISIFAVFAWAVTMLVVEAPAILIILGAIVLVALGVMAWKVRTERLARWLSMSA